MWEYTDKVKDHFLNPRNVGDVENPDGVAEVGSIACGDALKLSFKLDGNKRIKEARFKTFGCASAIATSSALTEMVKGMTLDEALKVSNQDIAAFLGGLPQEKMHCSVMGKEALEMAIANYRGTPGKEPGAQIICECFGVTDRDIERAVRENNLTTVEEVTNYTKAGGGCGNCHEAIQQIIERVRSETKPVARPKISNIQKMKMIEETIEREIRPSLKHDGGDIERCHRQPGARRHARGLCGLQILRSHAQTFRGSETAGSRLAGSRGRGGGPMKTVYLDNNATTQVAAEVMDVMAPYFRDLYGNPSSMHSFGGQVGRNIREAREQTAALIGALPDEIIFTSCGTESDNAAIRSALATNPDRRHIVTSRVEHPAIKSLGTDLARQGYRITELPVDKEGLLDLDQYEKSLTPDTAIVSLMWANNETGVLFPVEKAAELARERGILFHTDAVQAVGKIPLRMQANRIDMLSLSGHKLHAPKGIGVLYVRRGTKFSPFLIGGHQEKGRRGGTENTPAIVALGRACTLAAQHMERENTTVKQLRDKLEEALLARISRSRVNGNVANRLPNTTNISFEFVEGEGILLLMDQHGICASSGSACTSGSLQPSHVLRAMGVPFTMAHGSIRFSLSIYNTEAEIDFVIEKLPPIIERLRSMSPYWQQDEQACPRA
jgi:cysteine desulfurase